MPRGGYRSRHAKPSGSSPPNTKYTFQAWKEYSEVPLQRDEQDEDDARLKALRERDSKSWRQKDWALWDELCRRKEEREDEQRAPLRRELESYFDELGLPTLPPPMAKSSLWLEITRPCNYENENVRPFYVACEEGQLEEVRTWVERKKDLLQQIGLQDGLACAAKGDQVDVARYLLDGGYASLHGEYPHSTSVDNSLLRIDIIQVPSYKPQSPTAPSPSSPSLSTTATTLTSRSLAAVAASAPRYRTSSTTRLLSASFSRTAQIQTSPRSTIIGNRFGVSAQRHQWIARRDLP
jgi:hypothetical protein